MMSVCMLVKTTELTRCRGNRVEQTEKHPNTVYIPSSIAPRVLVLKPAGRSVLPQAWANPVTK